MIKKGFTLIELLVVIAIIAILAAILFPVFAKAKKAAMASGCLSNMKQIAMAQLMYADDSDGFIARTTTVAGGILNDPFYMDGFSDKVWMSKIFAYVKNVNAFTCPADPKKGIPAPAGISPKLPIGYAMWQWSSNINQNPTYGSTQWQGSIGQVANPADVIMLCENYIGYTNGGPWWIGWPFPLAKKHGPTNTYAFYDGHVKALKMIDTVNVDRNMWNHLGVWPANFVMDGRTGFSSAQDMRDYSASLIRQARATVDTQE